MTSGGKEDCKRTPGRENSRFQCGQAGSQGILWKWWVGEEARR
jgi:hypothetical protein